MHGGLRASIDGGAGSGELRIKMANWIRQAVDYGKGWRISFPSTSTRAIFGPRRGWLLPLKAQLGRAVLGGPGLFHRNSDGNRRKGKSFGRLGRCVLQPWRRLCWEKATAALLDEPHNHSTGKARNWLGSSYLTSYPFRVCVISHDPIFWMSPSTPRSVEITGKPRRAFLQACKYEKYLAQKTGSAAINWEAVPAKSSERSEPVESIINRFRFRH